jgi:predicted  nucleic acid-binding Zn-ribbon protein
MTASRTPLPRATCAAFPVLTASSLGLQTNTSRTQSSLLVDLNDTVQVHLLTETALFESRDYEILSQEEADELKKQVRMINQMIQQTRSNLAVQSKYRDAAISMSKLYSPTAARRRSLLGNRASGGDSAREVEAERETIQKKCEELASELWVLERRIMEPQRRLLEHTAGILQLTHKSAGRNASTPKGRALMVNGAPASPESMYTTSNGRNSMEPDDVLLFDESSWDDVAGAVGLDGARSKPGAIEIPLKSPVREQQKLLAEETERLREENTTLKQEADSLRARVQSLSQELESLKDQGSEQWQLISDTEKKLETFNNQLRQVIVSADPAKNDSFGIPPSGQLEPGDLIGSQLDYLEKAVLAVGDSQGNSRQAAETTQGLNRQVHELMMQNGMSDYPMPPDAADYDDQSRYMQEALGALGRVLQNAASMAKAGSADRQKGEQSEAILMGLWEIIQSGYADIQQRSRERKRARMEQGGSGDDEDDMSDTEAFDPNEPYSLSAFSTKVQWLYAESTKLKEQKAVLKRQIKQQRELNSKSDSEKDKVLRSKESELEEARGAIARAEKQTDDVRQELSETLANLETVQNNIRQSDETQSAASQKAVKEAEERVSERDAQIATLEASTHDMQKQLALAEANIATITAQIRQANESKSQAEKAVEEKTREVAEKQQELADKQNELDSQQKELAEMTGMVAEFKMEATLAKAELDGAYGSRRERAAEAAALTNTSETTKLQARVDVLQPRIEELEKELKATVQDLKDITKQAIDAETKIAELEGELDQVSQSARKEKEQLQDALDQERLKLAVPLSPSGRPNASILTDTYRDALKAERKKYEEQLKVCLSFNQQDPLNTLQTNYWYPERTNEQAQDRRGTEAAEKGCRARQKPAQSTVALRFEGASLDDSRPLLMTTTRDMSTLNGRLVV